MVTQLNSLSLILLLKKFGGIEKMFQFEIPICDTSYDSGLRCYEDDELGLVSFVPFACDATPTIELEKPIIAVHPTLFTESIFIELEQN